MFDRTAAHGVRSAIVVHTLFILAVHATVATPTCYTKTFNVLMILLDDTSMET